MHQGLVFVRRLVLVGRDRGLAAGRARDVDGEDAPAEGAEAAHDGADLADADEGDDEEDDGAAAAAVLVLDLRADELWEDGISHDSKACRGNNRVVDAPRLAGQISEQWRAHEAQELGDAGEDRGEHVGGPTLLLEFRRRVVGRALAEVVADEVCVDVEGDE